MLSYISKVFDRVIINIIHIFLYSVTAACFLAAEVLPWLETASTYKWWSPCLGHNSLIEHNPSSVYIKTNTYFRNMNKLP